jgi:DNA-binding transcriptional LysR family regulator
MNLSLERVLRFVAVAERLSFTQAARHLNIDQPWLSRQIMQLEEQLGFTLFNRSSLRITLTPEGAEFLEHAREVVDAAQRIGLKAEEINRRVHAKLKVGITCAAIPLGVHEQLLTAFSTRYPDVLLDMSAYEQTTSILSRLEAGDLDFGFVLGPLDHKIELPMTLIGEVSLRIAIPQEAPLAQQRTITAKDLRYQRIAIGEQGEGYERMFEWLTRAEVIKVPVLGGRRFIFDVAERQRLLVICYNDAEKLPDSFVVRKLVRGVPRINLCFVRRAGTLSPVAERLWHLGAKVHDAACADHV